MTHRIINLQTLPSDVIEAAVLLRKAGGEAFLVGGAVRDLLIGKAPGDFDLATNLLPERVATLFPFTVPTGIAHGTISIWMNVRGEGKPIEVTTYRADTAYSDGRRPDGVVFKSRIEDDLARRDFTMNAIALDPSSGALVDPYGGQDDLAQRVLKAVRDPLERFAEDGLRPMRAVRFASQLGCTIEANTFAAISQRLDVVRKVSAERLRDELVKILGTQRPSIALALMRESGLLSIVIPELADHRAFAATLEAIDAASSHVARLGVLLRPLGESVSDHTLRRLKFSNDERELITALVKHSAFSYHAAMRDGAIRRFVGEVGEDRLEPLFDIWSASDRALDLTPFKQRIAALLAVSSAVRVSDLKIDGTEVMRVLGIPPSRKVRDVLDALLDRVLEEPSLNERDTLIAMVKRLA
jgi:tRNA nucleotidyltransferase (CCA-adding enzyme)